MIPHEPRTWATDGLRLLRVASPLILGACALAACGRVPGQFEIVNNQVPGGGCTIPVNAGVYQGQGRLDVSLVQNGAESAFYVFPLLRNNLPGASGGGPDTNQITMKSFAVDLSLLTRAAGHHRAHECGSRASAAVSPALQDPVVRQHLLRGWNGLGAGGRLSGRAGGTNPRHAGAGAVALRLDERAYSKLRQHDHAGHGIRSV